MFRTVVEGSVSLGVCGLFISGQDGCQLINEIKFEHVSIGVRDAGGVITQQALANTVGRCDLRCCKLL